MYREPFSLFWPLPFTCYGTTINMQNFARAKQLDYFFNLEKVGQSLSYLFTNLGYIWARITKSTNVFCFFSDFPTPILWRTTSGLWAKTKGLMMTPFRMVYHVWLKMIKYHIFSTNWFFWDIGLWLTHTTSCMLECFISTLNFVRGIFGYIRLYSYEKKNIYQATIYINA